MTTAKTKAEVQKAVYDLWYKHYTRPITQAQRNQLAEKFTETWLSGWFKDQLYKPNFRHPQTRHKSRQGRPFSTIGEILADFVLRADMNAERYAEYPVTHDEQDIANADDRWKYEVGIFTDEIDTEAGQRIPFGYVSEDDAAMRQVYRPVSPMTVEQYRAFLARVKYNAESYADKLELKFGYDKKDVLKRIKGLRLERVRECEVCGSGFYTSDLRRYTCDQQLGVKSGGGRSEKSACELLYQAIYQAEYYQNRRENA